MNSTSVPVLDAWHGLTSPTRGQPVQPLPLPRLYTAGSLSLTERREWVKNGHGERVTRGVYASLPDPEDWYARARQRIASLTATLTHEFVLVGPSAAIMLGLWVGHDDGLVHIAVPSRRSGKSGTHPWLRRHYFDIPRDEIRQMDGVLVTSVARTAVDCARLLRLPQALPTLDSALVIGVERDELHRVLAGMNGFRGVRAARRAVDLARLAGSPKESSNRGEIVEEDLPMPDTLVQILFPDGGSMELDMAWRELRQGIEVHGMAKYRDGARLADAPARRARAETIGWTVVDVYTTQSRELRMARVRQAYVRAWMRRYGRPPFPD